MILPKVKRLEGFTLIEMLIVVAIMIVLFGLAFASFGGMRDSIMISENYANFSQDIRWAQKSSILLKRDKGEWWPYGIGLDLRNITTTGEYKYFKWCSSFSDFDPNGDIRMNSELPKYDPSKDLTVVGNATLPNVYGTNCSICSSACTDTLVELKGRVATKFDTRIKTLRGTSGSNVAFVLFESVTGRAFLYDASGKILNYTTSSSIPGTTLLYSPTNMLDVQLQPKSDNMGLAKRLTMSPVSGRVQNATPITTLR